MNILRKLALEPKYQIQNEQLEYRYQRKTKSGNVISTRRINQEKIWFARHFGVAVNPAGIRSNYLRKQNTAVTVSNLTNEVYQVLNKPAIRGLTKPHKNLMKGLEN